jgi:hypothetical protein
MKIVVLGSQAGAKRSVPSPELFSLFPNPYSSPFEAVYEEGFNPKANFLGSLSPSDSCKCRYNFWTWYRRNARDIDISNLKMLHRYRDFDVTGLLSEQIANPDITAWDHYDRVSGITHGRRLFITSLGFLGLAPQASVVGDEICALLGGKVPYVIRRYGDRYTFVGECYIFGLMNGEVLAGLDYKMLVDFYFV